MGRVFNEVMALDVGELEGDKILVTVDHATRYYQGSWIRNKIPLEIWKVFCRLVVLDLWCTKKILSDNGLEFQNEKVKRPMERFQIKMLNTATESLVQWDLQNSRDDKRK